MLIQSTFCGAWAQSGPRVRLAVLATTALLLAACNRNAAVRDDSQIAVHVNRREVSVHQVQSILQRQPRLPAGPSESAPSQVLEILIDQELAAQAAVKQGLESDPSVIQALQLAKRETLARAYFDRLAANAAAPSSDEIDRYYESHPALFAQRRLYTLQEFAVEADTGRIGRLRDITSQAKSAEALANALRDLGLRFTTRQFVQAAEDVPLGLLSPLSKAMVGQSVLMQQAGGARIFTVLQLQQAPVERRMASDPIAKYLVAEQKRKLISQAMADLRRDAQLEYVGAFAKVASATAATQGGPAASGVR